MFWHFYSLSALSSQGWQTLSTFTSPVLRFQLFLCPKLGSSWSSLLCNSTNALYTVCQNTLYHLSLNLESYFRSSIPPSDTIVHISMGFLCHAFARTVACDKHGTGACINGCTCNLTCQITVNSFVIRTRLFFIGSWRTRLRWNVWNLSYRVPALVKSVIFWDIMPCCLVEVRKWLAEN